MDVRATGKFLSLELLDRQETGVIMDALEEHAYLLETRIKDNPESEYWKRELDMVEVWMEAIEEVLGDE